MSGKATSCQRKGTLSFSKVRGRRRKFGSDETRSYANSAIWPFTISPYLGPRSVAGPHALIQRPASVLQSLAKTIRSFDLTHCFGMRKRLGMRNAAPARSQSGDRVFWPLIVTKMHYCSTAGQVAGAKICAPYGDRGDGDPSARPRARHIRRSLLPRQDRLRPGRPPNPPASNACRRATGSWPDVP